MRETEKCTPHSKYGIIFPFNKIKCIRTRIKYNNFNFAVMLSCNCQAGPYLYRSGYTLPFTTPNMDPPDNHQTTYDSQTKIVVFYSVSIVCQC